MSILLVAATTKEILPVLEFLRKANTELDVDVLITGIGLVRTTYSLTRQLSIKRPELIIQAGIGGSFDEKFIPGSVVVITKDAIADQGVLEKTEWLTMADLNLESHSEFPSLKGWYENPNKKLIRKTGLRTCCAVSVNQVSTAPEMLSIIKKKFRPGVESMEGAALHFIGLMEKIPFLQIRSISNFAGDRNKKNWEITGAVKALNQTLIQLLKKPDLIK